MLLSSLMSPKIFSTLAVDPFVMLVGTTPLANPPRTVTATGLVCGTANFAVMLVVELTAVTVTVSSSEPASITSCSPTNMPVGGRDRHGLRPGCRDVGGHLDARGQRHPSRLSHLLLQQLGGASHRAVHVRAVPDQALRLRELDHRRHHGAHDDQEHDQRHQGLEQGKPPFGSRASHPDPRGRVVHCSSIVRTQNGKLFKADSVACGVRPTLYAWATMVVTVICLMLADGLLVCQTRL